MKVMVVGAGQMGSGIAQVCAQAGYETLLNDISPEFISKGLNGIEKNLAKLVAKGKMDEGRKAEILSNIKAAENIDCGADCDIIIEAAVENM